jgi:hypothetical protein
VPAASRSSWRWAKSVIVRLGDIAFTRMPDFANSRASALVSELTRPSRSHKLKFRADRRRAARPPN